MNIQKFESIKAQSHSDNISKNADYCKNYFAAQNKLVKKSIFEKLSVISSI